MKNWVEFIDYLLFNTEVEKKELKDNLFSFVLKTGTQFNIYLSDDASIIYDILYWNPQSTKESEEFKHYLGNGDFSESNMDVVRKIFSVPLSTGWTDIHYLKENDTAKIERYYGIGVNRELQVSYKFNLSYVDIFLKLFKKCETRIIEIKPGNKL